MRNRLVAIGMLLAVSAVVMTAGQNGSDLYQQGLARETAGDIKGAVQIFERIVRDSSANRTLTAKALVKLGEWSDLLGQDARSYYERVVREFADQPGEADLVAQAKSRLTALARTPAGAAAAMTVRPLPELSNGGEVVTVSPDGTKAIVMDYSIGPGQNIALYDFSSKQTRLLTDLDWLTGSTYFGVWSPDARRVAHQQNDYKTRESELRVTTLDGRSSTVYRTEGFSNVQPVGWTPDGATLVLVVGHPDKTWVVGTLPATGGRFTPLRSFGWSYDWHDASPRLSPDGRFVAYLEGEKGLRDVHVVSLDGRDAHRITDDPADDFGPIWSPDSRHLGFISTRLGTVSLWTIEVKDGQPAGQPLKLKDGMQSARLLDWTARGIFYDQQTTTWDLYSAPMEPIEQRPTGSPRPIPYSRTGRNVSPAWSPDGEKLAFVSSAAAEPNRRYVVVMPADGGQAREFLIPTTTWDYSQSPYDLRWFGDGHGLGFSGTDTHGAQAVFRLLLETGEWDTIPLSIDQARTRIEWNRDGSAFYYARRYDASSGIFERAVKGDAERPVYRSETPVISITSLEFGHDRKWLAFEQRTAEANYTGRTRILILDTETGKTRTALEDVIKLSDPWPFNLMGWTPAGDLLIKRLKTRNADSENMLVSANGGAPRPFAMPAFQSRPETQPDLFAKWSPTGRSMVVSRVSRGWETFLIENPLAAVRATTVSR